MAKKIRPNPMIAANDCIDFVASQTDECILMCSLGKDSIVTLDMIAPKFKKVYACFMAFVHGLEHIERWKKWVTARYKNVEMLEIPHWNLTYILRSGLYCTPHPKQKLLKLADVQQALRLKHGCQWVFLGMKKADSMNRNLMITRFKDNHYTDNFQAYPLAEFSQKQILSYMNMHHLPEPVQYGLSQAGDDAKVGKASNGIGFNVDCLLWLEKNFPQDLAKIYKTFPLCERVLLEYHYQEEKRKKVEITEGTTGILKTTTSTFDGMSIEKGEKVTCVKNGKKWELHTDDGRIINDVPKELLTELVKKDED